MSFIKEDLNDEAIRKHWTQANRLHRGGSRLGVLIAKSIADDLEAAGVTEADIDRLFPSTPDMPPHHQDQCMSLEVRAMRENNLRSE